MGECALLAETAADAQTANAAIHALAATLERFAGYGIERPVPGVASLLIPYNPALLDAASAERLVQQAAANTGHATQATARLHTIGVRYGGTDGPDLAETAATLGISEAELVALHCAQRYRVLLLGFAPGFPYLGPLPPILQLPRRATPRVRVPAGSVAIAAEYSGIYPTVLPGGWHLLGRCEARLFDPAADPPAALLPGDELRFEPLAGGVLP